MNPLKTFTDKELEDFKELGINFEDRLYSREEIKRIDYQTRDYIMSQSSKNGDITKTLYKFEDSLKKMIKYE